MTRTELENFILGQYDAVSDYPWTRFPTYQVFRHPGSKKWFAVIMDLPRRTMGLDGEGMITVVNVKGDPVLVASLNSKPGYFPAYHMNKEQWLSVEVGDTVPFDEMAMLIDMSYQATLPKKRIKKSK